jgi:pyruvate, water dikinase
MQTIILKGTPASPGQAQGRVRIVCEPADCARMEKGEILVAEMTDPRYVPAFEKAVAVVTDIGGLLCHAAIVSREMKLPCIVNAKTATQVLKTGEAIVVDATNGVIYAA